jgi:pilus assembly protein CpaB
MLQMRSRTIVLAGIAVALVGAVMVFVYARTVTSKVGGEAAVAAFVAARDIPAGTKWESAAASVKRRMVPASLRPSTAVTDPNQLAGRTSVRAISKGEVVSTSHFGRSAAAPGSGLGIPPGHNAVTMNMPPPQGVAHYTQPGDLVNVYVTIKTADGSTTTKLLLSNVQVLANRPAGVQESSGVASSGEVLLTLALTPDQAERVIFAKENGSLWFGLVRPGDQPATTGGRTINNVLS